MTGIIAIGFKTEALVSNQGTIPAFPADLSRLDYERLVDTVRSSSAQSGHVVAVYPRWAQEPALARLETARAALNTRRLATYATALPPLAGAALVSLASAVSPYIKAPGVLVAGLPALEKELVILAWLASVTRLDYPSPSMAQHIASMSPTTAFGVSYWPEPAVKLLTKKDRAVPLPKSFRPMVIAVSARDGDGTWIDEVVAPGLGGPPVVKVEPTPLGAKWWGTPRLVEAVAYPVDIAVISRRITEGLAPFLCRWCGEAIATRNCPFCGLDAAQTPLAGGAA